MGELISIIVPVYNVEDYLDDCIGSLIRQSYSHIEIILVDDGSTDHSGVICDQYFDRDDRIKVVHKKNGGLSDARNKGLMNTSGNLIVFVDSDDVIDKYMIEELYVSMKKNNSDIAVCFFDRFKEVYGEPGREMVKSINMTGKEYIKEVYSGLGSKTAFVAWNKMYKKSLFLDNGIVYPYGRIYEDIFTTYKLFLKSDNVSIIGKNLYHYRIRDGSIMQQKVTKYRCIDAIDSVEEAVNDFYKSNELELLSFAYNSMCNAFIKQYYNAYKFCDKADLAFCKKYILEHYRMMRKRYSNYTYFSLHKKIIFGLFIVLPKLVSWIYMLLQERPNES